MLYAYISEVYRIHILCNLDVTESYKCSSQQFFSGFHQNCIKLKKKILHH